MGFGSVFKQSLKDYRANFGTIVMSVFVLVVIPLLVVLGIGYVWAQSTSYGALLAQQESVNGGIIDTTQQFYRAVLASGMSLEEVVVAVQTDPQDPALAEFLPMLGTLGILSEQAEVYQEQLQPYTLTIAILTFLGFFVGLIGTFGLLASAVRASRFSFRDVRSFGRKFYWKYLGAFFLICLVLGAIFLIVSVPYFIVMKGYVQQQVTGDLVVRFLSGDLFALAPLLPFLIPYFLLLLIALSPLLIYWIFTFPVISDEQKGVFFSFGKSMNLVSGRWWKTFWGVFFLYLIISTFSFLFGALSFSVSGLRGNFVLTRLWDAVGLFVLTPFMILFLKNLYLEAKQKKRK